MGRLVDVDVARKLVDEEMYWNESKKATVRAFFSQITHRRCRGSCEV